MDCCNCRRAVRLYVRQYVRLYVRLYVRQYVSLYVRQRHEIICERTARPWGTVSVKREARWQSKLPILSEIVKYFYLQF